MSDVFLGKGWSPREYDSDADAMFVWSSDTSILLLENVDMLLFTFDKPPYNPCKKY